MILDSCGYLYSLQALLRLTGHSSWLDTFSIDSVAEMQFNPCLLQDPLMESLKSSFLCPMPLSLSSIKPHTHKLKPNPLSDDYTRRIIIAKGPYPGAFRGNKGPQGRTPRWVRRSPEQMVQYLQDDRYGHLYGKHVVAAIKAVRSLSQKPEGGYDMRMVMGSFVAKLSFNEMCIVLKEQKAWRQVRDFFAWMKLQVGNFSVLEIGFLIPDLPMFACCNF